MKKIFLTLAILAASLSIVFCQPAPQPNNQLKIKNNGVTQGVVDTINFTTNQSATVSGGTATVTASGGSGGAGGSNTQIQYNNAGVFAGGNMYVVGNNLGIGSTNPAAILDVNGVARVQGILLPVGSILAGKVLTSDSNGTGTWQNLPSGGGTINSGNAGNFPYYAADGTTLSNQSVLTTNGTTNVGIGSPSPTQALDVAGTVKATDFVGTGVVTGLTAGFIPEASSSKVLANSVIKQVSSNIGINQSSPAQLLDVNGTIKSIGAIIGSGTGMLKATAGAVSVATGGSDYQTPLTFSTGLTNGGGTVVVNNSQNIVQLSNLTSNGVVTTSGGNGTLSITSISGLLPGSPVNSFQYNNAGVFAGGNMYTDTNGNIGIGTSTIPALVTIKTGQGNFTLDTATSTLTNPGAIYSTGVGGLIEFQAGIQPATPSLGFDVIHASSVNKLPYWLTDDGNYYPMIQLFPGTNGIYETGNNVGLGSINPGQQLDVVGTVRATSFVGDGSLLTGVSSISGLTTNKIPKATSSTTIGDSSLINVGSNVGLGSATPGQILDVQGTIRTTGFTLSTGASSGYTLISNSAGIGTWQPITGTGTVNSGTTGQVGYYAGAGTTISGTSNITIVGSNVGIGSATPGQILDANGTIRANAFISTGSGDSLLNQNGGNVGINSATPGQKLDTQGTIRSTQMIDTGVTASRIVMTDSNKQFTAATAGTDYAAATSGSSLLFGNGSGGFTTVSNTATNGTNVGIGSATPGQILDVQGTVRTTGLILSGNGAASGSVLVTNSVGLGTWMTVSSLGAGNGTVTSSSINTVAKFAATGTTVQGSGILFDDGTNVGIGTAGPSTLLDVNRKLNVLSGGNVGIGSLTPGQLLDINGTLRSVGAIVNGNVGIGTNANQASLSVMNGNVGIGTYAPTSLFQIIGSGVFTASSQIGIGTASPTGALEIENGNVGIGTPAAGQLLYVNGKSVLLGNVGIGTATPVNALAVVGSISTGSAANVGIAGPANGIYSQGNVGIGSLSPGFPLDVQGTARMSLSIILSGIGSDVGKTDATICEDTSVHQLYSGSGTLGICLGTSTMMAKQNIVPIGEGIPQIMALKPVSFNYRAGWGFDPAKPYYGFLAEDVQSVLPRLVGRNDKGEVRNADYVGMIPVMVKAIQQLKKEVDDLKSRDPEDYGVRKDFE